MNRFGGHIKRGLPAILLASFFLLLPSCDYVKQKLSLGKYSLKSAIEWAKKDSARVADSLKTIHVEKKKIRAALPDSVKKVIAKKKTFERTLTDSLMSIEASTPQMKNVTSGYYIIVGSFANHGNAVQRANEFSAMGYNPTIINSTNPSGTLIELVSVKEFKNKNEATLFLNQFQGKSDPGAWIYSGN